MTISMRANGHSLRKKTGKTLMLFRYFQRRLYDPKRNYMNFFYP